MASRLWSLWSMLVVYGMLDVCSAGSWKDAKVVSMWYSVSDNYAAMLDMVRNNTGGVSTVILDCGHALNATGYVNDIGNSTNCRGSIAGLAHLNITAELAIGLFNSSMPIARMAFQQVDEVAAEMVALTKSYGNTGWSFDFEPQGSDPGKPAEASDYATFLSKIRTALNPDPANPVVRINVCVAQWSPVLSQYAAIAPAVDRLLTMETYNQASWTQWYGFYKLFEGANFDKSKMGIGIFPFCQTSGGWACTPESVDQRMKQMETDNIPEVFVFRILPTESPPWPWAMWWGPLKTFLGK